MLPSPEALKNALEDVPTGFKPSYEVQKARKALESAKRLRRPVRFLPMGVTGEMLINFYAEKNKNK